MKKKKRTAFVLGNGNSRQGLVLEQLKNCGTVFGCNALYREFSPDFLIAVDARMIIEISNTDYPNNNQVWTNPNKISQQYKNLNFFKRPLGWSSGPTALHMASEKKYKTIYILGFDYVGLEDGKKVNNIYSNTLNYKNKNDTATYYGNWLKQTVKVIQSNPGINYVRVIGEPNYIPKEFSSLSNLTHINMDEFKKIFNI